MKIINYCKLTVRFFVIVVSTCEHYNVGCLLRPPVNTYIESNLILITVELKQNNSILYGYITNSNVLNYLNLENFAKDVS